MENSKIIMTVFWEAWGIVAGMIIVTSYFPQLIKGYKTKKLDDFSYLFPVLIWIGMFMWTIYGFAINSLAVITANILALCFNSTLIGMKYYYSKKR